jgi:hypothetical protein
MVAITSPQAGVDVIRCLIEHGVDVSVLRWSDTGNLAGKVLSRACLSNDFMWALSTTNAAKPLVRSVG